MTQSNQEQTKQTLGSETAFSSAAADRYYNTRAWAGRQRDRAGKLSHGCIAWMLGLPLPIVILAFLWRGCD